MAIVVIVGPPFSGKSAYARAEIARREKAGEYGLISLDYTGLYTAITPGTQSSFRDEEVSDSGAPRFAGYLFAIALAQMLERELDGYVSVPSPRRALEIADRANAPIVDIEASVDQIAIRVTRHMRDLSRTVPRATRERSVGRCRKAATAYLRDERLLVGKARTVTRRGNKWRKGPRKTPFDRAAFERGLTPDGAARSRRTNRGRTRGPGPVRHFERAADRAPLRSSTMTTVERFEVSIECRAADYDGPGTIHGTILEVGRIASDRREVFTPGAPIFPREGVTLYRGHRGKPIMNFQPVVSGNEITIDEALPDTDLGRQVATEVRSGARAALSVEFVPLSEAVVSGIRELRSVLVQGAALVPLGSYSQARAEIRSRAGRRHRRSWQ